MNTTFPPATVGYGFAHRHLLGIEPLQPGEIAYLLDRAAVLPIWRRARPSTTRLAGSTGHQPVLREFDPDAVFV